MSELDDPRVLFAAERTVLAWSRTAAGLMALGFFVDRASLVGRDPASVLDQSRVGTSLAVALLGLLLVLYILQSV